MSNTGNKINVGIDAKWFFSGPPSGNMVVKNLVNEMILHNHDRFNLHLFIPSKFKKQAQALFPADVKLIGLPEIPNLLSNQFLVPLAALRHKLKAVLFQNFASTWPGKLHKIAYIHDVLFLDYPEYYSGTERFYFKQMKRLASRSDTVIAISESEKERLLSNNVSGSSNTSVVYHGINESFKPKSFYSNSEVQALADSYGLPAKYLLFVGRVNVRKNLLNLVKALLYISNQDIPLVIAGERNNLTDELETLIAQHNLSHRIIITGHVPEADLQVIYACATIFCFPSYAEGFGLPPLEAMKCGVPVIVSDRTAMPEVCGDAAVYIDPDNPYDIARKIDTLLNNPDLYNDKVAKGLQRAEKFVWSRSAQQILTIIEEAGVN
ncbi:glycosyltransferase family 4 protein [Mucilaginibacter sp. 21P]|uniref:glycosyltransferase family 4 protein n=1 Tax=Mucilaginibacter sp. 21P TaxID=2778902 RepID=UPI001C5A01DC|nr:glycosyltransferase family 1 protein [Mucilaginibacter sp. 21P]QXV66390.1 glycosyltransferase family 4 protein [Mucilaginibacter sp. 21P]